MASILTMHVFCPSSCAHTHHVTPSSVAHQRGKRRARATTPTDHTEQRTRTDLVLFVIKRLHTLELLHQDPPHLLGQIPTRGAAPSHSAGLGIEERGDAPGLEARLQHAVVLDELKFVTQRSGRHVLLHRAPDVVGQDARGHGRRLVQQPRFDALNAGKVDVVDGLLLHVKAQRLPCKQRGKLEARHARAGLDASLLGDDGKAAELWRGGVVKKHAP